jgi:hypothetical protein
LPASCRQLQAGRLRSPDGDTAAVSLAEQTCIPLFEIAAETMVTYFINTRAKLCHPEVVAATEGPLISTFGHTRRTQRSPR